jgi:cation diffusion facilitator family transporter
VGSLVNVILLILKFLAGILGNSAAMIADAVHTLSDFITDIIVLVFVRISNKPVDKCHDYGHGKYETFAVLIISMILMFVAVGIMWNGIKSIVFVVQGNTLERPGMLAFVAALVSIVFKEILYQYTVVKGRKLKSDALIANAWHHRSDALSSIGTTVGIGGAIFLGEKWTVLDPIAALCVGFFIIRVAIKLIKPCLGELVEKSLPDEIENEIINIVNSFEDVTQLHNLRTRRIGNKYAIEFHVKMNRDVSLFDAHEVITKIENDLKKHYGAETHVIIHVEPL